MNARKLIFLFFIFTSFALQGQTTSSNVAIGYWREHFPYSQAIMVAEGNGKVYCATQNGLFFYDTGDNTINRLSKVNGLSDVGVSAVSFNNYNNTLLVTYTNANIDLITKNGGVINASDIKRANILGKKTINNIFFRSQYAYLACGFGIVVYDTDKMEVKDTYYIGTLGGQINVRDITSDGYDLFAATDLGIYRASLSNPNLSNYTAWSKMTGLPSGIFNTATFFNNKVVVNFSKRITSGANGQDTIFSWDGAAWSKPMTPLSGSNIMALETDNNKLVISASGYVDTYNSSMALVEHVSGFQCSYVTYAVQHAVLTDDNVIWIADLLNGLIRVEGIWSCKQILPSGPLTTSVTGMDIKGGTLWVAPGNRDSKWQNGWSSDGIFFMKGNEEWTSLNYSNTSALASVKDIINVTIHPDNNEKVYAGTLGRGVIEFTSGVITNIYDAGNSTLEAPATLPGWVEIGGSAFDEDGNIWFSNILATSTLSVLKKDGSWQAFAFPSLGIAEASFVVVNQFNQKWVALPRGQGILVLDENKTFGNASDDRFKKLTIATDSGGLPSAEISALAEDKDGEMWVGTNKGIAVFYTPDNIFSATPSDAQQILIEQDGHTQILLETEVVTAITIDGANRKWIGTENSGVFLMSEDGTKQIEHFTAENSPLLSNTITSISINQKNGEIFFGTAKGIISYRGTATEGEEDFSNIYAFPNPVRPGYNGIIAITGLTTNADVKITDISGTLIYQTKALGGQAIWNGTTFNGQRAHSGVYLVFCASEDGSKSAVTKLLIIN